MFGRKLTGRLLLFAVCSGLGLCLLPPFWAGAESAGSGDELMDLIDNGAEYITLTSDIVIGDSAFFCSETPVAVDMGPHTITVLEDARLYIEGPVAFVGGAGPLFRAEGGCRFDLRDGASIAANGENAVAIMIEESVFGWICLKGGSVSASGKNAVAIKSEAELYLEWADVLAKGENSCGIHSGGLMSLGYCRVRADGVAALSDEDVYLLDSVAFRSGNNDYFFRPLEARFRNGLERGYSGRQGDDPVLPDNLQYELIWRTMGSEDYIIRLDMPVEWDVSDVDIHSPGVYTVTAIPKPSIPDIPFDFPEPFTISYTVIEPETPYISDIWFLGPDGLWLSFLPGIGEDDDIRLFASYGAKDAWEEVEFTNLDTVTTDYIILYNIMGDSARLNQRNYFRIEVTAGYGNEDENEDEDGDGAITAVSNIFEFYCDENDPDRLTGGDRDGGDRTAQVAFSWGGKGNETSGDQTGGDQTGGNETGGNETGGNETLGTVSAGTGRTSSSARGTAMRDSDPAAPALEQAAPVSEAEPAVPAVGGPPADSGEGPEPARIYQPEAVPPPGFSPPQSAQAFSSRDLLDLAEANPTQAVFLQNGMKLAIPSGELERLAEETGMLYLQLERDDEGFSFRMFSDTGGIEPMQPLVLWVPAPEGAAAAGADGAALEIVGRENGMTAFRLEKTGRYILRAGAPVAPTAVDEPAAKPVFAPALATQGAAPAGHDGGVYIIIAAGMLLMFSGIILALRRVLP